jgi:geranylgeranyl reductase family protein
VSSSQQGPASLPDACDVLVVGAGPAGSACALELARQGVDTLLVDQHDFPRDKICGDGLIPDAHAALARLGVLEEVLALAQPCTHVRAFGPSGLSVDVPGKLAVLPRKELDHVLVRAAERAGARLATPWRLDGVLREDDGRVCGVRLRRAGDGAAEGGAEGSAPGVPDAAAPAPATSRETVEVRARHVVIATGASPQGLVASGLCERREPSAMGLRGYVHHPGLRARIPHLEVAWYRPVKPGYGWVFPCPGDVYNIGVGIIDSRGSSARTVRDLNLREVFDEFVKLHAPARELMNGGTFVSPLKGAPLRTSLKGARVSAPGILVTGEAAGSTYSFTGEGIGKAMETGLLAADALRAAREQGLSEEALGVLYAQGLRALKPKFDLYEKGNRVNHHPWLGDLLIRRARKSQRLRNRMAAVLEERATPAQLITLRGLVKLFIE